MKRNFRASTRGFTLIELLIAVTIIAILAAIAYPTYNEAVRKARRAEARALLLEIAARQEQFFASRAPNTYGNTVAMLGYANPQPTEAGWYRVSVTAATNTAGAACNPAAANPCVTFTLTAAPDPARDQKNDKCGSFTIDHLGVKGVTGGSLTVADCW